MINLSYVALEQDRPYSHEELINEVAGADRPTELPVRIEDVQMRSGELLPPRVSRNHKHHWCLCCDTLLFFFQQSPLCKTHQNEHRSLRQRQNKQPKYFKFERQYLEEAHDLLDRIDGHVGRLIADLVAGKDYRPQLRRTAQEWAEFTSTFRRKFPRT